MTKIIDYYSTRDNSVSLSASEAIAMGLAPDGGLYVPREFPSFSVSDFAQCVSLAEIATVLIRPFVVGSALESELAEICQEAFTFDTPIVALENAQALSVLELFHGPTAAFKDVGARFLAACMERIESRATRRLRILVATSGDTGGAVAAAFHGRDNVDVDVFYPAGQVSARQEQQLTCWGDNVRAFRVKGRFDDCQNLVKAIFQDPELARQRFSSANSINLGRLLPQMVYYAYASLQLMQQDSAPPGFIIPTGNLGNALACVWARRAGLPIGKIVLATNENRTIGNYLHDGQWQPQLSVSTLASAMDVGNPSNMERLRNLYSSVDEVAQQVSAYSVSDAQIRQQIAQDKKRFNQVWCPHTATALHVYDHHLGALDKEQTHWVAVATAHPAKFETIVEPLINETVEVPVALAQLLELPASAIDISAQLEAVRPYYVE